MEGSQTDAYVEQRRAPTSALDEAILEGDKGFFVSGEKVFAWLEDLRTDSNAPAPEADVVKART
ncbi:hypothetical protein [Asticcacaulis sp. AC402]|uniref:hypothetical protein n=1 Tax=Asticcacaulis sp. AC402 TaxID=1282361 RepID=UPI0003C3AD92|nr:hypothetical protein [Asticcacaulis sp. AC402]ESQ75509.1 hypothetical protein ABAC402_08265 [Asticcacaulis sp. AC402]